jgi:hypothetical protein
MSKSACDSNLIVVSQNGHGNLTEPSNRKQNVIIGKNADQCMTCKYSFQKELGKLKETEILLMCESDDDN